MNIGCKSWIIDKKNMIKWCKISYIEKYTRYRIKINK